MKDIKKEKWLEAMEKTFGNIGKSARIVGVHRSTPHKWALTDPKIKEALENKEHYKESFKDMVESELAALALKRDKTVLIFLAKTQLQDRGYVERQIHEFTNNKPILVQNVSNEFQLDQKGESVKADNDISSDK